VYIAKTIYYLGWNRDLAVVFLRGKKQQHKIYIWKVYSETKHYWPPRYHGPFFFSEQFLQTTYNLPKLQDYEEK
jgi:hypothetical protein